MTSSGMHSSMRRGFGLALLCLGAVWSCDYVEPDPLPPSGDEWVMDAVRRAKSNLSNRCRNRRRFFRDSDGDGFGDPKVWVDGCRPPKGYVQNGEDCYDRNPNVYPGQTESFAKDRGDGSFDYDCDGRQNKRMTNRAYCIVKEDGTGCRSASGWLESKIPRCGRPGRWKWYECVTILYRPQSEQAQSGQSDATPDRLKGAGAVVGASQSPPRTPVGGTARPEVSAGSGGLSLDFKKRFLCKGRTLPWKKRQLCR